MNIHLIAIGGSIMHNLAIELKNKGHNITGSDDFFYEPSKSRLEKNNILPEKSGWHPKKITKKIDIIILGMHADIKNPELQKAIELKLPIYSYPEYIFKKSNNKKRIVIGGSHGKTTITSMILHVLKKLKFDFDYLVGAQIQGFENMVRISSAPIIVIEGDEYLCSSINKIPKFHIYKPNIAVISGISWDHINVFPTFENYINQFRIFKNSVIDTIIYNCEDNQVKKLMEEDTYCKKIKYKTPKHSISNGKTSIDGNKINIFGIHNLQNLNAALSVCKELGISKKIFYKNIKDFKGASKRLELLYEKNNSYIYKDFAHSPSKVIATIKAMKSQFPKKKLVACLELYTFSSLNKKFLKEYKHTMKKAEIGIVYINPKSINKKNINNITKDEIIYSFGDKNIKFFNDSNKLKIYLTKLEWNNTNLILMSSGNFNSLDFSDLI